MGSTEQTDIIQISEVYGDLIPGFIQRRHEEIKIMEKFYESQDFLELAKLGHKLEGASYSYGFYKLGDIAKSMRLAGEKQNLPEIRQLIDATVSHLNSLKIEYI